MPPVFPNPQFKLLPDTKGPRQYGNVSNILDCALEEGNHRVCLAVPTQLFVLMQQTLHIPPESRVTLSIDQVGEVYLFSLLHEPDQLIDLWSYTRTTLPVWILTTTRKIEDTD